MLGAGALGCYYGAKLAKAGEDVHFLVRSGRAAVMARGIRVKTPTERIHLRRVQAYGSTPEIGPCDLVIIAVKATTNDVLRKLLPPLLHENTTVLTLQNGLGVEEPVAEVAGAERVLGAICYIASVRTGPGVINCTFPGLMMIGEFGRPAQARTRKLAALLQKAGIKTEAHDNLEEQRWRKLVWNVPFNGLSAAMDLTTDVLIGSPEGELLVRAIMAEVIAGAKAVGVELPGSLIDGKVNQTKAMGAYFTSSHLDMRAGRPMEVEAIFGCPLRTAQAAGQPMPLLSMLYRMLKLRDAAPIRTSNI